MPLRKRRAKAEGMDKAQHMILVMGTWPGLILEIKLEERAWTYFEAMVPKRVLKSLTVIGLGASLVFLDRSYEPLVGHRPHHHDPLASCHR